jgi:hypothetical protein
MSNYLHDILKLFDMDDLNHLNEPKSILAIWDDTRAAGFEMPSEPLTCSF